MPENRLLISSASSVNRSPDEVDAGSSAASTMRSASAIGFPHDVKNHNLSPSSARGLHVTVSAGRGTSGQHPGAFGLITISLRRCRTVSSPNA